MQLLRSDVASLLARLDRGPAPYCGHRFRILGLPALWTGAWADGCCDGLILRGLTPRRHACRFFEAVLCAVRLQSSAFPASCPSDDDVREAVLTQARWAPSGDGDGCLTVRLGAGPYGLAVVDDQIIEYPLFETFPAEGGEPCCVERS